MDFMLSCYRKKLKDIIVSYHFTPYQKTYFRIINDVLQTFTFVQMCSGHRASVEFGVCPLCMRTALPWFPKYRLDIFYPEIYMDHGWVYEKESTESMEACVDQIVSAIHAHLIPLFLNTTDSRSLWKYVFLLQDHAMEAEGFSYQKHGMLLSEQELTAMKQIALFDGKEIYDLALKCGEYDFAEKFLLRKIDICKQNIKSDEEKIAQDCITGIETHKREKIIASIQRSKKKYEKKLQNAQSDGAEIEIVQIQNQLKKIEIQLQCSIDNRLENILARDRQTLMRLDKKLRNIQNRNMDYISEYLKKNTEFTLQCIKCYVPKKYLHIYGIPDSIEAKKPQPQWWRDME